MLFNRFVLEQSPMNDNIHREAEKELEGIFKAHNRALTAYLRALLGNEDAAVELAQETFVVAFEKLDGYDRSRPAGPWLRGIARNLARNLVRKQGRHKLVLAADETLETLFSLLDRLERERGWQDGLNALRRCMKKLSPAQRKAVGLYYEQGRPTSEVAKAMRVQEKTVYQQLWAARKRLRKCIEERLGSRKSEV